MSKKSKSNRKPTNQKRPEPQRKKPPCLLIGIVAAVVVAAVGLGIYFAVSHNSNPSLHHARIEIADYGTITVELDADAAPISVENFITLAKSGFYDGLTFHRIMEGFMMQGGAPADGQTAKTIKGEFSANGVDNPISHTRGVISMARANDYDSGSSQFFIVHQDSTFLDGNYAAFGHVTDGMDVVDKICTEAKPTDGNGTIPADEQPVITTITILD